MDMVELFFHETAFPDRWNRDLIQCLEQRRIASKFHYATPQQSARWWKVHCRYAPWQTEPPCREVYTRATAGAAARPSDEPVTVVGLGCGPAEKERLLLRALHQQGRLNGFRAVEGSVPLALEAVLAVRAERNIRPEGLIADLDRCVDWSQLLRVPTGRSNALLVTCFGVLPNFQPDVFFARLRHAVDSGDRVLLSANLAPERSLRAGLPEVLPLYENDLTRAWLGTFLEDLGVGAANGRMEFATYEGPFRSTSIRCDFVFATFSAVSVGEQLFTFQPGERLQLFESYRYTPALLREAAQAHRWVLEEQWVTPSIDEGVFLLRPA